MSHSYPIWTRVARDNHDMNQVVFGARHEYAQTILVGTSAKNSHPLGVITVQRRELPDGSGVEFALYLDNTMLRRGILDGSEFTREDITEL